MKTVIKILGDRNYLYQWDINQRLIVSDKCAEVHFSHAGDTEAAVLLPYEKDGMRVVNIPNILLQSAQKLLVYVYITNADESHTEIQYELTVFPRERPANYIYEETEIWEAERAVKEALAEAKESGEFDGEDGYTPVRGTDYWTPADIAEIKSYVDEAILGGAW